MKMALIGCGLLGGSTAAAWRRAGCVSRVRGYDRDRSRALRAQALGIVDECCATPGDALAGADCAVLATPVGAMDELFGQVARSAPAGIIVTDVGSTKAALIEGARQILGEAFARFVPAHPIAGGALAGIEHADAALFEGRWVITTPDARTDAGALARIEANWSACGAVVERMGAAEHDRIFAAVSHLPHLLAFALVHQIAAEPDGARLLRYAGAGFRDFTRIAASDPTMWRDIALANRDALVRELSGYRGRIEELQRAVADADGAALSRIFEAASRVRREQTFAATPGTDED